MKLLVPFKLLSMGGVLSALLLTSFAPPALAQGEQEMKIVHASKKYDLFVRVKECGGPEQDNNRETCSGPARISFHRKGVGTPFQTLRLPNVELYRETLAHGAETSEKPRGLYAEEYGLVFDDFNFDGAEDLAVCNGRDSGYGGPSYTVLLYDAKSGRFAESRRLTALAESPYLGLFFPDKKRRLLVAYSKSGCCYHETAKFRVVGNRPVLVEKITEQASGRADGAVDVVTTTERRVGRRWVTKVRRKIDRENRN